MENMFTTQGVCEIDLDSVIGSVDAIDGHGGFDGI